MQLTTKIYHVEIWLWTIFLLIVGIVMMYIYIQHSAPNLEKRWNIIPSNKKTTLSKFLEQADNGDIILMSGDTRGERTCRWCAGTVFSHVGFLFREIHPETKEDILYIWDCDIGQKSKDGVRIMPLKEKLDRYKGFKICGWRRFVGERPDTKKIVDLIGNYLNLDFDSKIVTWWVSRKTPDGGGLYRLFKDQTKVFCSELLAMTLQDLNILHPTRIAASYSPADFEKDIPSLNLRFTYLPINYFEF
jgi:hypothetical protein